jgi:hypothetical protein
MVVVMVVVVTREVRRRLLHSLLLLVLAAWGPPTADAAAGRMLHENATRWNTWMRGAKTGSRRAGTDTGTSTACARRCTRSGRSGGGGHAARHCFRMPAGDLRVKRRKVALPCGLPPQEARGRRCGQLHNAGRSSVPAHGRRQRGTEIAHQLTRHGVVALVQAQAKRREHVARTVTQRLGSRQELKQQIGHRA